MTTVTLRDGCHPAWASDLARFYPQLVTPSLETLFPLHFVQVVLPKIGGKIVLIGEHDHPATIGFLFPRKVSVAPPSMGGSPVGSSLKLYTLRLHPVAGEEPIRAEVALQLVNDALDAGAGEGKGEGNARAVLYKWGVYNYRPSAQSLGTFDNLPLTIGRPSEEDAATVRAIHQQIWNAADDALYPTDIHSREFGLATDLVVRIGEEVGGFLMGFYKNGGSPLPSSWWEKFNGGWRIESQVMGVLPRFRGNQMGYLLKRAQGELAVREGIGIVNWTADPLQFPNAVLNFGKLGAVAFDFYPDLYPFRNELNQVPTSRFGLTCLVGTEQVRRRPLDNFQADILDVAVEAIPIVNEGYSRILGSPTVARIAIEIPANWTAIQQNDVDEALRWRSALDEIFDQLIGIDDGKYAVTGVGVDGDRCYLIAERSNEALWTRLAT